MVANLWLFLSVFCRQLFLSLVTNQTIVNRWWGQKKNFNNVPENICLQKHYIVKKLWQVDIPAQNLELT